MYYYEVAATELFSICRLHARCCGIRVHCIIASCVDVVTFVMNCTYSDALCGHLQAKGSGDGSLSIASSGSRKVYSMITTISAYIIYSAFALKVRHSNFCQGKYLFKCDKVPASLVFAI